MTEADFITAALKQYRESLNTLPDQFAAAQRASDRKIDALCEQAGIMGAVQGERDALIVIQKQIQQQADLLSGRINMLEEIHKQFHLAPIPEGVTHQYGIELASIDPETRLKVMHGQGADDWKEMITALGGDPDWGDNWTTEAVDAVVDDKEPLPVEKGHWFASLTEADEGDLLSVDDDLDEPGPEDSDLDDIELAEIESRIEEGTATPEDLQRATAMLARTRATGG